jgi:hypothetical protein
VISEQVFELRKEFAASLERLASLVENRSAWSDGISGCREALVTVTEATAELTALEDGAKQLESDLATARAENETLSRNHADLRLVETQLRSERESSRVEMKGLRAETERLRKKNVDAAATEQDLRAELAQQTVALEQLIIDRTADDLRFKEQQGAWLIVEQQLRAELERYRATFIKDSAALANTRSLAQQLIRETSQ